MTNEKAEDLNEHTITCQQAYNRIRDYYTNFLLKWESMTDDEKSSLVMGNGRKAPVNFINTSAQYIKTLPATPTIQDAVEIGKNVLSQVLEFGYHDQDQYGIKMCAYARHILEKLKSDKAL